MKKVLTCLAIIMAIASSSSHAQSTRVNVYTSYVFDDAVDSYFDNSNYYRGKIKGGLQWGAGIEYKMHPMQGIELLYLRQDTKAPMEYYQSGIKFTEFDLTASYLMLASNRYFSKPGSRVEGFGGGMIGATFMNLTNPANGNSGTKTKFAWGIRGGANIWASPVIGIKLQAQLLSAVQSVGGGFYFGTGGLGTGLATYSSVYQFSLGGGLVFNFNAAKK